MYRNSKFWRWTCRLPGRQAWRRSAECNCPLRSPPRATNKVLLFLVSGILEEIYSRFWTSFRNLIVVQCPAGTLHPQLHHPPRKLRSKGCHLYFSWLLHDSNRVIAFRESIIFPHDNNWHNSCNLTPPETGCHPRSSASRSWDPGLDWLRIRKIHFAEIIFQKGQDLHEGRLALLIRAGHNNLRFSFFTELSILFWNAKFGNFQLASMLPCNEVGCAMAAKTSYLHPTENEWLVLSF